MTRHLHFDCASGAAGDMLLAAQIAAASDRTATLARVKDAVAALGLPRDCLLVAEVVRGGIAALDVKVDVSVGLPPELQAFEHHSHDEYGHDHEHVHEHKHDHDHGHDHEHKQDHGHDHEHKHDHGHDHDHGHTEQHGQHSVATKTHHTHIHYQAIRQHIVASKLDKDTANLAVAIFDRLAAAEAKLHGTTVDTVSFHEVGAIDSIVDIVANAAAFIALAPSSVSCSAVAMGSGTIRCAHGVLPVPAPAALEIMASVGARIYGGGIARELCTPTGAAVLAALVDRGQWHDIPLGRVLSTGWGSGDANLPDRANVVRATVLELDEMAPVAAGEGSDIWQLDTNIDDMNPQFMESATAAMFAAGALDVWWTPILMKKQRNAQLCSALVAVQHRQAVLRALFSHTTTIGVRMHRVDRAVAHRTMHSVTTPYGAIAVKVAKYGADTTNVSAEYDDCAAAASAHSVSVKVVHAAALAEYYRVAGETKQGELAQAAVALSRSTVE